MTAFSDNQLAVFVLANLLTGAVNVCMDTKAQSAQVSLCMIALYSAILAIAAMALQSSKHRTRSKLKE